ncbi:hypothetical protein NUBL13784_50000 [Klebsiella pneumoniae]|nr:hypothetical protein NUBL13784_50000 [Klebsiella pneumoniae]
MPYPAYVPSCGLPPRTGKRSAAGRSGSIPAIVPDGGINALSGLRSFLLAHTPGPVPYTQLTLSQNIAIGMGPEFRPMLRFYVTGGQVDNEHTAKVNGTQDQQLDSLNVGGMFEAWF